MLKLSDLRLAGYLDEAADEPAAACQNLAKLQIRYVVLRQAWTTNVCTLTDQSCQKLKTLLDEYQLIPIAIASELGKVEAKNLGAVNAEQFNRAFDIAAYFKIPMMRFYAGLKIAGNHDNAVSDWLSFVTEHSLRANIIPMLEVTHDAYITKSADLATLLVKNKRWRLWYDPVQLILRQNQDPFIRYWTLLKTYVEAIDVRDYKIGYGCKPVGYGDAKIELTVKDAINVNYKGWYFCEPSLGRKYGSALTKADTFKLAVEAFEQLLQLVP